MRYYLNETDHPDAPRSIYDNQDGMLVMVVEPQAGKWTDERQALLDMVMKVINVGDTSPATA